MRGKTREIQDLAIIGAKGSSDPPNKVLTLDREEIADRESTRSLLSWMKVDTCRLDADGGRQRVDWIPLCLTVAIVICEGIWTMYTFE